MMKKEETLVDISDHQVSKVVQGFVKDDAQKIELVRKSNEKWDITAHFETRA